MPNKKAAVKAMAQSEKRRLRKRSTISAVKTFIRNAERQIVTGAEEAKTLVVQAQRALDKAAEKGILHANNAARRKSRLLAKLNKAAAVAAAPVEAAPTTRRRASTRTTAAKGTTAAKKPTTRAASTTPTRRRTTKPASE